MRELISAADDECVKGVTRIQLCCAIPIESRLRYMGSSGRGVSGQTTVVPNRSRCWVILGRDKLDFLKLHAEIVDSFLDQVGVFISHVTEFGCGHAHEKNPAAGVAV